MRGDELDLLLTYPKVAVGLFLALVGLGLLLREMSRDGVFDDLWLWMRSWFEPEPTPTGFEDDSPDIKQPETDPYWQHWQAMQKPTTFEKRERLRRVR